MEQVLEDAGARWGQFVEIRDVDFNKLVTTKTLAPSLELDERNHYQNIFRLTPTSYKEYVFLSHNNSEAEEDDIELLSD